MVDIPGNASTSATITVGASVQGSLETLGDHDWYRIELTAGQKLTILLTGLTLEDPYLRIRNAAGTMIFESDDINPGIVRDSKVVFTVPSTGTYYLDAGAWDEDYTGTYDLSVQLYTPPPVWTVDQVADYLVEDFWGGDSRHFNTAPGGSISVNITALTPAGKNLAQNALALWSDVTGIAFSETSGSAQITFNDNQSGAFADSTTSGGFIISSNVNVSTQWLASYGTGTNSYSFQTYVHEIGHALGLGHAGPYNGTGDYESQALYANDGWPTTVMSYFSQYESKYFDDQDFSYAYVVTPMIADIAAMQTLYGLSTTTRTGNTTYGFNSTAGRAVFDATANPAVAYTIVDSGGIDTLDYSGFSSTQMINLNAETFSSVGGNTGTVSIGRGTVIENAIGGTGADTIIGNSANNVLNGGASGDTLYGNAGNDRLNGGTGNDILDGGDGTDSADYSGATAGVAVSLLVTGAQNTGGSGLDTLVAIENLKGSSHNDQLTGDGAANVIDLSNGGADQASGGDGNDGLYFGAALGSGDFADGGAGSDDQIGLQGNYAGLILNAANFPGIETFSLLPGNLTTFGDSGTSFYDYNITTAGSFGRNVIVSANRLRVGEDFTFNGSAETTGSFTFFGGFGTENLTGGNGSDGFYFGPDGRFGAGDMVNGGGGSDNQLGLHGDYTVNFNAAGFTNALTNIQTIALLSDTNPPFAGVGDGEFDYAITLSDGLVAAGQQLTVTGTRLTSAETMVVDGSAETNGTLRLFGGAAADTLTGGGGADIISGGLGADSLRGNGGADQFLYADVAHSAGARDWILDFVAGSDTINLGTIDADTTASGPGNDAFAFIGAQAFSGTAGQLRAVQFDAINNYWQVQGDVNGDSIADFALDVALVAGQLTSGDFLL